MADGAAVCPSCGYKASAQTDKYPMALPPGTVLNGRYILGRVLGQGGFGITYVAQDHKTGSLVAVKEYFPDTMAARTGGPLFPPTRASGRKTSSMGRSVS